MKTIHLLIYSSFLLHDFFDIKVHSEINNNNSLLNLFCLENVKGEMINAGLEYEENFAKETCECYLKQFYENGNHDKAIYFCKEIAKEKFDL